MYVCGHVGAIVSSSLLEEVLDFFLDLLNLLLGDFIGSTDGAGDLTGGGDLTDDGGLAVTGDDKGLAGWRRGCIRTCIWKGGISIHIMHVHVQ